MKTALEIVASRPKWAGEIVGLLGIGWRKRLPKRNGSKICAACCWPFAMKPRFRTDGRDTLRNPSSRTTRVMLLDAMGRAPLKSAPNGPKMPSSWHTASAKCSTIPMKPWCNKRSGRCRARRIASIDYKLIRILQDAKMGDETHVQAFAALAVTRSGGPVNEPTFEFLIGQLKGNRPPLLRPGGRQGIWPGAHLERRPAHAIGGGPRRRRAARIAGALGSLQEQPFRGSRAHALGRPREKQKPRQPDAGRAEKIGRRFSKRSLDQGVWIPGGRLARGCSPSKKPGSMNWNRSPAAAASNRGATSSSAPRRPAPRATPSIIKAAASGRTSARSAPSVPAAICWNRSSSPAQFRPRLRALCGGNESGQDAQRHYHAESTDAIHLLTTERLEIRIGREEIESFVPGRVSIMPAGLETTLSRGELHEICWRICSRCVDLFTFSVAGHSANAKPQAARSAHLVLDGVGHFF